MMMSIVHRITGAALYFGTLLLAWWLIAAALRPNAYGQVQCVHRDRSSAALILFGYTWALIHHMLGGIRHLIWDTGRGFGPNEREWLTLATLHRLDRAHGSGLDRRLSVHGRRAMSGQDSMRTPLGACAPSRLGTCRHRAFLAPARDLRRGHCR